MALQIEKIIGLVPAFMHQDSYYLFTEWGEEKLFKYLGGNIYQYPGHTLTEAERKYILIHLAS